MQFTEDVIVSRSSIVTRHDVNNIKYQYGTIQGRKSTNDTISVDVWRKELEKNGHLLCYHPQNDKKLFYLGIQTQFQLEMLIKHGQQAICVDSTHGTNMYGFLLVTLLIVDEFGLGVSVAWFITTSEDQETLSNFFSAIYSRSDFVLFFTNVLAILLSF